VGTESGKFKAEYANPETKTLENCHMGIHVEQVTHGSTTGHLQQPVREYPVLHQPETLEETLSFRHLPGGKT
jgi:hypothetical protein